MVPGWAASRWMSMRVGIVAGGFECDGSSVARADPSLARNHNRHHTSYISMHLHRLRKSDHKVSLSFTSLLAADLLPFPLLPDPMPRLRSSRTHASTVALEDGEEGERSSSRLSVQSSGRSFRARRLPPTRQPNAPSQRYPFPSSPGSPTPNPRSGCLASRAK